MDRVKNGAAAAAHRLHPSVLDLLYLAGVLVLAGVVALTARAAAKR